jgi:aminoglycoside/choline kinase family phosphotransferase
MKNVNYLKNIKVFCERNNIDFNLLKPLKNDASKRKYYRFTSNNKEFLLMDSSLEKKSLESFIEISKWLKSNHLTSPEIFRKDKNLGLLIIEDFGNNKYSILCKKEKKKKNFYYREAIKLLTSLSEKKKPGFIKDYNYDILKGELDLYIKWELNIKKNKKAFKDWDRIWSILLKNISYKKTCVVLRDFHVDNIFYLRDRSKLEKVGLIDFQDSLIGHPAYDLVSLLQDVRAFLSFEEQDDLYKYYKKNAKIKQDEFKYAYLVLGTQRLFKIIGIFKKLAIKQGKINYLRYLPRTKKLIKYNLRNPIFNELKIWLKTNGNNE